MISHIIRKEILENLTTYRFFILTGMLGILMVVSIIISYGDYELRLENFNLNRPKAHTSNVMIPPSSLSIFAKGVDAHLGRLHYITSMWIEVQDVEQSVNRLFSLFQVPDMLFIVKVMLSLIALLFSFDSLTGEKESGTLKLALASGANKVTLLIGKLLGRFSLVSIPFFVLFSAAAITVSLLPDIEPAGDYWNRILCFLLVSLLYIFVYAALGVFLSSLVHESSTSIALCLGAWVLFVFVVPQAGITLARTLADVPTSDRIEVEHRLANIKAIYERIHQNENEGAGGGEKRMVEQIRDANSKIADLYRPKINDLIRLSKNIGRISPAGSVSFILTDITSTGVYEELRYKDAVAMFAQRNFEYINDLRTGEMEDFQYQRASLGEVMENAILAEFTTLLLIGMMLVTLSTVSFIRYDVR